MHKPLKPCAIEGPERCLDVDPGWQGSFLFGHVRKLSLVMEVRFLCSPKITLHSSGKSQRGRRADHGTQSAGREDWSPLWRQLLQHAPLGFDGEGEGDEAAEDGDRGKGGKDVLNAVIADNCSDQRRSDRGSNPQPRASEASPDRA